MYHPFLVHFPIALLSLAVCFEILRLVTGNNEFSRVGWWLQLSGTLGLAGAIATGILAKVDTLIRESARACFEAHEQIALINGVVFAALLFWRMGSATLVPARYQAVYLLLLVAAVCALWTGAWYGGELVYRFGTGVRSLP